MIKMTIHNGEEVQQRNLPCDFLSLRMSLYQMNLMRAPHEVSVRDVEAEFTSDDPLGQKLIGLIRPGDLLSDVDVAVHQLKAAPAPIRDVLCQQLMDGAMDTVEDIAIQRGALLEQMCGFRQLYYFPLACSTEDEDGELIENDSMDLTLYSEEIQDAIKRDQARDIDTMAMYFWAPDQKVTDSIKAKLLTCEWGLEEIHGNLYGRVEVTATALSQWKNAPLCGSGSAVRTQTVWARASSSAQSKRRMAPSMSTSGTPAMTTSLPRTTNWMNTSPPDKAWAVCPCDCLLCPIRRWCL